MKSKELAKEFHQMCPDVLDEEKRNEALVFVMNDFIDELHRLKSARNIQTDSGLIPIFKELDQKWNSLRNHLLKIYKVQILIRDGFKKILQDRSPETYEFYIQNVQPQE